MSTSGLAHARRNMESAQSSPSCSSVRRVIPQRTNRMAGETSTPMHTHKLSTLLLASAISGYAFVRPEIDPLRVPDCDRSESSTLCGIRSLLYAPDDGNGGGGGGDADKKFTQAEVNKFIEERLAKKNQELADVKKASDATTAELATMKAQLGELSAAAQTAKEEAELKGKSDLEKLQIQFDKAQKRIKEVETERDTVKSTLTADLDKARGTTVDYAKRQAALGALASGLAEGAEGPAVAHFLASTQIELNDKFEPVKFTYDGKEYDKPALAAGEFLKVNKFFAKAADGGSGQPTRGGPNNGSSAPIDGGAVSLLSQGLAARSPAAS